MTVKTLPQYPTRPGVCRDIWHAADVVLRSGKLVTRANVLAHLTDDHATSTSIELVKWRKHHGLDGIGS